MQNISVIGAGTMGNGIAHVFAQNGYKVNLIDVSSEALEKAILTRHKQLFGAMCAVDVQLLHHENKIAMTRNACG